MALLSEEKFYKLELGNKIDGNVNDYFKSHGEMKFSTVDVDNDASPNLRCAQEFKGGWWFRSCYEFCLTCKHENGFYINGTKNILFSYAKMMIKPSN